MFDLVVRAAPRESLINCFENEYEWLSNFFRTAVHWRGIDYPSAEHAFQAGKTDDQNLRCKIADAPTPSKAKYLGRRLLLCPDWDDVVRHIVMQEVIAAKFTNPELASRLIDTGTALLVEGNVHHDDIWGDCRCPDDASKPGQNLLGRELMRQRALLNPAIAQQWTRVAVTGHRPHNIPDKDLRKWAHRELVRIVNKVITNNGTEVFISGLAMGPDLWFAEAAQAAGARVWGYSPYPEQENRRWPQGWKTLRADVIAKAERVEHLGPRFDYDLLGRRNRWLVRDADALVAVIDTSRTKGGTVRTVGMATGQIPIVLIDLHTKSVRLRKVVPPSGRVAAMT